MPAATFNPDLERHSAYIFVLAATIGVELERYVAVLQIGIKGSSQLVSDPEASGHLSSLQDRPKKEASGKITVDSQVVVGPPVERPDLPGHARAVAGAHFLISRARFYCKLQ